MGLAFLLVSAIFLTWLCSVSRRTIVRSFDEGDYLIFRSMSLVDATDVSHLHSPRSPPGIASVRADQCSVGASSR